MRLWVGFFLGLCHLMVGLQQPAYALGSDEEPVASIRFSTFFHQLASPTLEGKSTTLARLFFKDFPYLHPKGDSLRPSDPLHQKAAFQTLPIPLRSPVVSPPELRHEWGMRLAILPGIWPQLFSDCHLLNTLLQRENNADALIQLHSLTPLFIPFVHYVAYEAFLPSMVFGKDIHESIASALSLLADQLSPLFEASLAIMKDLCPASPFAHELIHAYKKEASQFIGVMKNLTESLPDETHHLFSLFEAYAQDYEDILAWVYPEMAPSPSARGSMSEDIYQWYLNKAGVFGVASQDLISTGTAYTEHFNQTYQTLLQHQEPQPNFTLSEEEARHLYTRALHHLAHIIVTENLVPLDLANVQLEFYEDLSGKAGPHYFIDALSGETGFNIPLRNGTLSTPEFTSPSGALVLTAHEVFPGHALHFYKARSLPHTPLQAEFIFNGLYNLALIEGWALYSEELMAPYMDEAYQTKLAQFSLLRAARLALDPALNRGQMTREEAKDELISYGFSPSLAEQEIYQFMTMPGYAPAYFYGFLRYKETHRFLLDTFPQVPRNVFHEILMEHIFVPFEHQAFFLQQAILKMHKKTEEKDSLQGA